MTHALNARPGAHPGHPPEELLIDAEVDDEPVPPAPPLRPWLLLLGLVLVAVVIPAAVSWLVSEIMRKKGLIKEGDYKLNL